MRYAQICFALLIIVTLVACEPWPRDPHSTTAMILQTGKLRVGVIHNPPWTDVRDGEPQGREIRIIEAYAKSLGAEPEWRTFGTHAGFKALEHGEIDLLTGGLVEAVPYKAVGYTRPYDSARSDDGRKLKHVFAVRRGENRFLVNLEQFLKQREGVAK